jgi:transcriptional regulator with XRE-family HTH domain
MTPFGHYLETVRRAREMQQTELANLLGIDPSYISSIERGKKGPPSADILQKIKTVLSLSEVESKELDLAVKQSERVIRLPDNTSLAEYAFISTLSRRIGSLSKEEVNAMACILHLGEKANCGGKIMS